MKKFIFMCGCIVAATCIHAQIIFIPNDYPSIQAGINAANPGDTIIVAEGVYYERINFMGKKPLVVASMYLLDKMAGHINNTVLDGSQINFPKNRSIVYFTLGEDTTSVLCGFTIRNGQGTLYNDKGLLTKAGGAIFISGSGAKITHNIITENHLNYNPLGSSAEVYRGGGIATDRMENDNWVILEHNAIDQNTCIGGGEEASGGGLSLYCNARIIDNKILNNTCKGFNYSKAWAGGMYCGADPSWGFDAKVYMSDNLVENNKVWTRSATAAYGGILLQHATVVFENNVVTLNEVTSAIYGGGIAGLGIDIPLEGSKISGNTFSYNKSDKWSGALSISTTPAESGTFAVLVEQNYFLWNEATVGGALTDLNVPVCLQNNVFNGNTAFSHGGAIMAKRDFNIPALHLIVLVNNTFYDNNAVYGGAICSFKSKASIVNSIFFENHASLGQDIFNPYSNDAIAFSHSDVDFSGIYGNYFDMGGNFSEDPLFEDLDLLNLSNMSPCIDRGDEHYICNFGFVQDCPACDISGLTRHSNGITDMGAHEFINDRAVNLPEMSAAVSLIAYPNPLYESTTFEYTLEEPGTVQIAIYDNAGRIVSMVANEYQSKGLHKVYWDVVNLPAGIYYYRLDASCSRSSTSGKLIKY